MPRKNAAARLDVLLEHERLLWAQGKQAIGGLDEAGAGPLAGPVVAACVVLDPAKVGAFEGVDDSKKLTPKGRAEVAELIKTHARAWAIASATVEEIDRFNILQAALLAMRRALEEVRTRVPEVDHLLIDARKLELGIPETALIKGDSRSLSIAAASVLAKVERDAWMTRAAESYPNHGFEQHKGYGTEEHLAALRTHGVTPIHRKTFEPINTMLYQLRLFD
jgi:ribonuclease HII